MTQEKKVAKIEELFSEIITLVEAEREGEVSVVKGQTVASAISSSQEARRLAVRAISFVDETFATTPKTKKVVEK